MKIMTSMDKAGMAIAVAVVAIAVVIASGGAALQMGDQSGTSVSPQVTQQQQMAQEKAQQTQKTMDEIMEEQRQGSMDQPSSVTVTPPKIEDVPAMTSGPKNRNSFNA